MSRLFDNFGMSIPAGSVIFKEGDRADSLYMIQKGRVKISKESNFSDEEISILGEREFFGEMALISSEPRSATAIALDDCQLIRMDQSAFEQSIQENPNMGVSVVRLLTRRLRDADDLITNLMDFKKINSLYSLILNNMLRKGRRDASRKWVLIEKEELINDALDKLPMDRDVVQSVLSMLEIEGKISIKKSKDGSELIACGP